MRIIRLRYAAIGTFTIFWLNVVIPLFIDILGYGSTIFPKPPISQVMVFKLIGSSLLLAFTLFFQGLSVYRKPNYSNQLISTKKIAPMIII